MTPQEDEEKGSESLGSPLWRQAHEHYLAVG